MKFSRQEYWSGLSFPSPRDLPKSGIELTSAPLQADSLPSEPPEKPYIVRPVNIEKAKEFQKNIYFCFIDYAKAFDCVDHNNCGKFFKRWEYQTTFPASSEICMQEEATVRTGHGKTDWFQIGKGVCQGCILSPCLFNLYAEYIMRNAGLDEAQLESRLPGELSIT